MCEEKFMEKKKVFISYSQDDVTYAKWLCGILEINDIVAVLPDRNNYDIEETMSILDDCDAFVSLYSKNIKQSDNQSKETEFAFNTQKPFFFLMLNRCELEGQYNYYLSRGERFDMYKNKAKTLRLLIGRIKNTDISDYRKNKLDSHHIELLDEEDIDFILSGQKKKKTFWQKISPFSRICSKHPIVNFALKCYSIILGIPFVVFTGSLLLGIYGVFTGLLLGESFVELNKLFVMMLADVILILVWNLTYYPSIIIAKSGIKNKLLISVIVFLSVFWITRV